MKVDTNFHLILYVVLVETRGVKRSNKSVMVLIRKKRKKNKTVKQFRFKAH